MSAKRVPFDEAQVTSWIQSTVPCLLLDLIRITVGYAQWIDTRMQLVADDRAHWVTSYLSGVKGTIFRTVQDSTDRPPYLEQLNLRTLAVVNAWTDSHVVINNELMAAIDDHQMFVGVVEQDGEDDLVYYHNLRTGMQSLIYNVSKDPHFPRDGWMSHLFLHRGQLVLIVARDRKPGYQIYVMTSAMDHTVSYVNTRHSIRGVHLLACASTPYGMVLADHIDNENTKLSVLNERGKVVTSAKLQTRGLDRLQLQHFADDIVLGMMDDDEHLDSRLHLVSFNVTTGRIQQHPLITPPEAPWHHPLYGFELVNMRDNGLCPDTAFVVLLNRLYSFRLPELDA